VIGLAQRVAGAKHGLGTHAAQYGGEMRHDIASTVSFQKRHDAIRVRRIMQAIRVRHFGGIDSLVFEEVPRPDPGEGEVLLRGKAAGVGPWDALVRAGRSVLPQPLPLAPGSDVSGVVERVGRRGLAVPGRRRGVWGNQDRSFSVLKPGGILVSAVAAPDQEKAARHGVRALFFLVGGSSSRLEKIAALIDAGELATSVGDVLPLAEARTAHEMLAGKPHKLGKIILAVDRSQ
jgi:NADPH:quinone reductase-like Zn-dependent oxidoreductase